MFDPIFNFIQFLAHVAVWSVLTLIATLFIFLISFTSLWTPWFYLTYAVSTLIYVVLMNTVLRMS